MGGTLSTCVKNREREEVQKKKKKKEKYGFIPDHFSSLHQVASLLPTFFPTFLLINFIGIH